MIRVTGLKKCIALIVCLSALVVTGCIGDDTVDTTVETSADTSATEETKVLATREYFENLDKESTLDDITEDLGQFGMEGSGIIRFVWRLDDGSKAEVIFNSKNSIERIYISDGENSELIYVREH